MTGDCPNLLKDKDQPTPQKSPDYVTMVASPQQANQPMKEVRGILPKKRKIPHGWLKCLKRSPPKITFWKNNIYNMQKEEDHHYEEPQEPQENNNRVFSNMQINEQSNENSIIQEDTFNENYELVEERETAV